MNPPFLVLGFYIPRNSNDWKAWRIGRALIRMTREWGLVPHHDPVHGPLTVSWYDRALHAEVRKRTLKSETAKRGTQWHQDGDLDPGSLMDCALVTWSNVEPTEFQWNGHVFQPKPFEVVISRNLCGYHRRPPTAPRERWLFRQRVQVPQHLNLP